jgi:hypothetical protein
VALDQLWHLQQLMLLVLALMLVVCGHETQEVLDDLVAAVPER